MAQDLRHELGIYLLFYASVREIQYYVNEANARSYNVIEKPLTHPQTGAGVIVTTDLYSGKLLPLHERFELKNKEDFERLRVETRRRDITLRTLLCVSGRYIPKANRGFEEVETLSGSKKKEEKQ